MESMHCCWLSSYPKQNLNHI
uniref:Uncharacterized protein n=1 Tax=Rhizophora mucronata TaxID=61149 RepID=A0A2P2NT97_RHIMU